MTSKITLKNVKRSYCFNFDLGLPSFAVLGLRIPVSRMSSLQDLEQSNQLASISLEVESYQPWNNYTRNSATPGLGN
jgi:hypothetical protein